MIRVNIEEVRALKKRLRAINNVQFKDIEWFEDGIRLEISPEVSENWRFVGMSNADFIETDYYKQ